MKQLILIAWRNLIQHRRRSLMLGGAIAGATALLVFLTCLSSGVKATMLRSATTVATGHINVGGFYKITAGQSAPLVTEYPRIKQIIKDTLPDLDLVTDRGRGWARLVSDEANMQVGIAGIDLANEPKLPKVLKITSGSLQDLAKPGTVLIFESQAKKLKVKVGDAMVFSVLTPRGVNNTVDVRVVAIAEDMGLMTSFNVFVPNVTLRQLYQLNPNSTGALLIYIKDMGQIDHDIDLLRAALTKAGFQVMDRDPKAFWMKLQSVAREDWTGQKLDLTSWEDEISWAMWAIKAIDGLSFLLTMVLLVIIAIGIMNTMWIAIRERTREIGTLRAIGMQRRLVLLMFVFETFFLGLLGTAAGSVIGCAFSGLMHLAQIHVPDGAQFFTMSSTLRFAFEPSRIVFGAGVITLCTTLVSVIPSLKAARMKPVTAMSHI